MSICVCVCVCLSLCVTLHLFVLLCGEFQYGSADLIKIHLSLANSDTGAHADMGYVSVR